MNIETTSPARPGAMPRGTEPPRSDGSVAEMLTGLLAEVIRAHEPRLAGLFPDPGSISADDPELLVKALQAIGMRLQLERIAEENTPLRRRRAAEISGGPDQVIGSFSHTLSDAAAMDIGGAVVAGALAEFHVSPTLTAHPTEAKRVTVLECLRRIYLTLVKMEAARWTPRERDHLVRQIRNHIEILWMTGELRIDRPSLKDEVAWGLHFFNETLFEAADTSYQRLSEALLRHYPEERIEPPAFFRFASWIGGDRDGNPQCYRCGHPLDPASASPQRDCALSRTDRPAGAQPEHQRPGAPGAGQLSPPGGGGAGGFWRGRGACRAQPA